MEDEEKEKLVNQIMDFRIFMVETVAYRKDQTKNIESLNFSIRDLALKIDITLDKLNKLPCKERAYIPAQLNAVWGIIGTIFIILIGAYFKQ